MVTGICNGVTNGQLKKVQPKPFRMSFCRKDQRVLTQKKLVDVGQIFFDVYWCLLSWEYWVECVTHMTSGSHVNSAQKKVQKMIRCGAPGVSQKKVRHSVVLADWMIQKVVAIFKKQTKTLIWGFGLFWAISCSSCRNRLVFSFERIGILASPRKTLPHVMDIPKSFQSTVKNGGFPLCFTRGSLYVADFD